MRSSRLFLLAATLLLGASLTHAQGDELLVTNVQVQQRPFTALVDVTYDLETVGDLAVTVSLFLSTNAGARYPYLCRSVTGDVGSGVLPGTSRHIVWDAGTDFPGFSSATCRLRVTADDAANLDDFVYLAPGMFVMGSPVNEPGRESDETQHQVSLTHGVYIQVSEVTNQQYTELVQWAYDHGYVTATSGGVYDNLDGSTQDLFNLEALSSEIDFSGGVFSCLNPGHPVKHVRWYGSAAYCDWLSLRQGLPRAYNHGNWQCNGGNPYPAVGYRLPTEAEWEYACRAGSSTAFANGPITYFYCSPLDPHLDLMGWYCGNASGWTHPAAQKIPNAWGLHDMHGNVWEWCNDWYDVYGGEVTDPVGPGTGDYRVIRGGSWYDGARYCRGAIRSYGPPDGEGDSVGFRIVRTVN